MFDIETLLDKCEYDYTLTETGGYEFQVTFDDGREQIVGVSVKAVVGSKLQACHIYSMACEDITTLKPTLLQSCLKNSSKHNLGAWELHGSAMFFCLKTLADFNEDDLRYFVNYVGVIADEFERKYRGEDTL